jgi:hypothetical protein
MTATAGIAADTAELAADTTEVGSLLLSGWSPVGHSLLDTLFAGSTTGFLL